jgi:hypothetical protein
MQYFTCIGAQKAGTSWLHYYLLSTGQVYLPPIKEMHFFDSVSLSEDLVGDFWIKKFKKSFQKLKKAGVNNNGEDEISLKKINLKERININDNIQKYKEFYEQKGDNYSLVGDITPAYSMLDENGFKKIREVFSDAKIIFIMRNPNNRYWSFLKMKNKQGKSFIPRERFREVIENKHVKLRSDYRRTITELDKVFPKEQVLYLYFEDLFGNEHEKYRNKIDNFLGISNTEYIELDDKKSNKSVSNEALPRSLRRFGSKEFQYIYEFCKEYFGYIPESWERDLDLSKQKITKLTKFSDYIHSAFIEFWNIMKRH